MNARYDQVVHNYISPTWQDEWLGPQPGRVAPKDRGVKARREEQTGKKVQPSAQMYAWGHQSTHNSIYSNSPHWDYPWLDARKITATKQPFVFSCFDR